MIRAPGWNVLKERLEIDDYGPWQEYIKMRDWIDD